MVERNDPGRTGVLAGRLVGLLTVVLTVATLWEGLGSVLSDLVGLIEVAGIDPGLTGAVLFWLNLGLAATTRYAISYTVGSLLGVCYDYLGRPSLWVLAAIVVVVGLVDGAVNGLVAASPLVGLGYLLAWLAYLPVFAWLYEESAGDDRSTPLRLEDV